MDRYPAAAYWAETCLGHFETMTSRSWPGETGRAATGDRPARRYKLPPLTASPVIIEAIAACAPAPAGPEPDVQRATLRCIQETLLP